MENLSVVVITRNRLVKLKRCLESVKQVLPGVEIVIVDNGSDDGTRDYLKDYASIKSTLLDLNIGVAGARNIGLKLATRELIMFLDDDAWLVDLDLHKIVTYFLNNVSVGIIAPRILYPNGQVQESVRAFPTLSALFWRGTGLYKIFPNVSWYRRYVSGGLSNTLDIQNVDWAIGACQIIRRKLFDNVGLLDDKYFFGYEDADFCLRAKQGGYSTVYWPGAMIYHEYARTSAKGLNLSFFRHVRSTIRFFLKSARTMIF